MGEDVVEDVVGGDFGAGDFAEVVETLAEVFGDEVGGGVAGEGLFGAAEGFEGLCQCIVMTCVCDDGMAFIKVVRHGGFPY